MTDAFRFSDLLVAAEQGGFFLYPKGTYDAIVEKAEATQSKDGSKPMLKVWYKVVTGPYAGRSSIINRFTISADNANSLSFFFRHMGAMGLPAEYFAQNPPLAVVAQHLANRPCRIIIDDSREYNNRKQNDVNDVLPPGNGGFASPGPVGTPGSGYQQPFPDGSPGVPAGIAAPQPPMQPAPQPGLPQAPPSPMQPPAPVMPPAPQMPAAPPQPAYAALSPAGYAAPAAPPAAAQWAAPPAPPAPAYAAPAAQPVPPAPPQAYAAPAAPQYAAPAVPPWDPNQAAAPVAPPLPPQGPQAPAGQFAIPAPPPPPQF
jgi:hypothetical protein